VGLAVAQPGDVADPAVILELDEVEPHRRRLVEFLNLTVAGFAGRAVLHCYIESGNLPILSVDEMIEVEQADFAALGGGLLDRRQ
jgi:hypothetical protein